MNKWETNATTLPLLRLNRYKDPDSKDVNHATVRKPACTFSNKYIATIHPKEKELLNTFFQRDTFFCVLCSPKHAYIFIYAYIYIYMNNIKERVWPCSFEIRRESNTHMYSLTFFFKHLHIFLFPNFTSRGYTVIILRTYRFQSRTKCACIDHRSKF